MAWRAACLSSLLVAMGTGVAAAADVGFSEPVALPWATGAYTVSIAQGAPGEAILSSATRTPGDESGKWQPRVEILGPRATAAPAQDLDGKSWLEPSVVANAAGQSVAAWVETTRNCCMSVSLATRAPGEGFGPRIDVPYGDGLVRTVKAAINAHGDSVLVYSMSSFGQPLRLWAVFRSAAGTFSEPRPIGPSLETGSSPFVDVRLDDAGRALVAWSWGWRESPDRVNAAVGTAGAGFGDPQVLAGDQAHPGPVKLVATGDGRAALGWEDGEDNGDRVARRVMVSFAGLDGRFSPPRQIGVGHDIGGTLRLAAADDGRVLASWVEGTQFSEWMMRVASADLATQSFAAPSTVDGLYGPEIGISRDGTAALARQSISFQYGYQLEVSQGSASGVFGPGREPFCPPAGGDVTAVGVSGPGDISMVLTSESRDNVWSHKLVRSDSLLPPPAERCPGADGGGQSAPPGQSPVEPPRVLIRVPAKVSAARAQSLPVEVSSTSAGRLQVDGRILLARSRSASLRMVHRSSQTPGVLQVHVRPRRKLRGATQRPRAVVVRVAFRDSRSQLHRLTRRVAVGSARRR